MEQEGEQQENAVTETYFDYNNQPVTGAKGFVTRVRQMRKKKVLSESWYDEKGEPMFIGGETYCRVDYTYDKAGNVNREKYYDADGLPVRCKGGYAIVYREYDTANRLVYEKYYDTDGFAIMNSEGAVSYRYEYDDDGNLIKTTAYDYFDHEVQTDGNNTQ